jgi:hypothetical protein
MLSNRNVAQPHVLAPTKQQKYYFSHIIGAIGDREKKRKKNKQAVVVVAVINHHTDARTKKKL